MKENKLTSGDRVREAELCFLKRWWWVFPVAGLLAVTLKGDGFWGWVEGAWPVSLNVRALWTTWALLAAAAGLLVPTAWAVTRRRHCPQWMALALALAGFVAVEVAVRCPTPQIAFWLASENRIPVQANMSYMHDVCHVRLDEATHVELHDDAVVLVGSSQIIEGVDVSLLKNEIGGIPVFLRAVSAMRPIDFVESIGYLPLNGNCTYVCHLSEFDFVGTPEFRYDWFRPFASWRSLIPTLKLADKRCLAKQWRGVVDYVMAASSELWRQRDWAAEIQRHFWKCPPLQGYENVRGGVWVAGPDSTNESFSDNFSQVASFLYWLRYLQKRNARIVIFEGQVNPVIRSPERMIAHQRIKNWLQTLSYSSDNLYYVPAEYDFPESEWRDMTHLNSHGREVLTQFIVRKLDFILNNFDSSQKPEGRPKERDAEG